MDQLTRIEKMLERIAVALEKANEPVVVTQETPASWGWPSNMVYGPGLIEPDIHVWTGPTAEDDKNAETCRNKFACAIDFTKGPADDRFLTREESHILNRAIKRSTIKAHGGKLEKD